MGNIGDRLREERMRIGLSQTEVAALGGLGKQSQLNYESGVRSPDANYLQAVQAIGVDILYVLTGSRSSGSLTDDESEILGAYRQLNEAGKGFIQNMLATYVSSGFRTANGQPASPERRVKRLPENRRAALDGRTAENVEKAMEIVEQMRRTRAPRKPRSADEK